MPNLSRRAFLQQSGVLLAGVGATAAVQTVAAQAPAWQQTSDKKIRIGVVGGRFGCSFHWHQHPNCTVAAVSDLIPDRRDRLMKTYACDKSYESLEVLIQDPNIDAVALFTGAPDHPRHTVACMEAGKHVISACPACMTLEDAAKLKEVKERTGLRYMSAETSYYRWETITARRMYQDGLFGELVYTEGEYYHPMNDAEREALWFYEGQRTWRYGFAPMLYPTHSSAFLVGVSGERLTSVSCIGWGDEHPALKDNVYGNTFWNEMGMFMTSSGKPFRCNVGWNLHAHGERAQWFGTKAALYMPGGGGQPFALQFPGSGEEVLPDYWPMVPEAMRVDSGHGKSHPFITNEFIMALVEDREPAISLYEALAFCVPGIVAHESSNKGGELLKIPSFDRVT
ncbi:MAG: Gfo/Idh/MocA family oxidoreductase [Candidatus Hydrogenedentes bacterium]|nr:Gfo/Idh/MocA family oxidoreductase [Candidatus Hydrogenedentota bacterium]